MKAIADRAPHWAAIVIVTGIFGWVAVHMSTTFTDYLENREVREMAARDANLLVAEQRIDTCHAVQAEATLALEKVAHRLEEQEHAFRDLIAEIKLLTQK
jgi:hypothetical protein